MFPTVKIRLSTVETAFLKSIFRKAEIVKMISLFLLLLLNGDGGRSFLFVNCFLFYDNISEIVYNKTMICFQHDCELFSDCDMIFKFVKQYKMLCLREKHASKTRKTVQPL